MKKLSRQELKNVMGGVAPAEKPCGTSNVYCGSGSGVTCCKGYSCIDAGNGQNPNVPGGNKLCSSSL